METELMSILPASGPNGSPTGPALEAFTIDSPDVNTSGIPEYLRRLVLADDGAVFAPAAIAGDEERITLAAMWDGISIVSEGPKRKRRHPFLPTWWLRREYPHLEPLCDAIEATSARIRSDRPSTRKESNS